MLSAKQNYPEFSTWQWKTFADSLSINPIEFIEARKSDHMFFIGTDSQHHKCEKKHTCTFTSAIVAYKRGKGGVSIVHSDKCGKIDSLRQRLVMEAMRSLECAWFLDKLINTQKTTVNICRPHIHLDVNPNEKHASSKYKQELVGMIAAQGYDVSCKPNAWAASSLADRRC